MDASPEPEPRYPRDAYAWSIDQAAALRRLRASGLPLPNDLDLAMVIEEIEAVGREQLLGVQGNLIQALLHLLKLATQPDSTAARHWRKETLAFLLNAGRRYRPSMRRALDLEGVWADVRRLAAAEFEAEEWMLPPLPATCPMPLEALLDPAADPRALAAALSAALAESPRPN